jgi:predicted PurR-regulated permease PerM
MKRNEITLGRFLRILLLVVTLVVSYFVINSLSGVLLPFAISWLLAYLLHPLVNVMQYKLRLKYRWLAIVATLLLLAGALYGVALLVMPSVVREFYALKDIATDFLDNKIADNSIPEPFINLLKDFADDNGITAILHNQDSTALANLLADRAQVLLLGTLNIVKQVFSLFIMLLYLFFILLDFERLSRAWKPYVPKKWRDVVSKLWGDLVYGMNQYFRGQALVALCVGVLFSIGFLIIDFPAAIVFGMFIGLLNLVPYLQVVSLAPMALLSMLKAANTGGNFWLIFLSALIVLCVVQAIQDLLLVPRIMGKRMNLHPAVILLSLSIWGHLLGMLGMIVALPLTTLILAYIKRYHEIAATSSNVEENILKEAIGTATIKRDVPKGKNQGTCDTENEL